MHILELPISLYSHKVRLGLALKGVEIELRPPPGGSYRSPEFRAINPAGTIPTLIDGDLMLAESEAILDYLDDLGLGRPLRPSDARLRARDRMLARWCDLGLEAAVRRLFAEIDPNKRDAARVAEADRAIAEKLALIEAGLDAAGPFATGAAPGGADCAIAATFAWLTALTAQLSLAARPGARLLRLDAAMAGHEAVAGEIAAYRTRVAAWLAERLG